MRIALFAWETLHSIAIGGIAAHATELAAALERRGHEVHVFTRHAHDQALDECVHGVWYHRCIFEFSSNFINEIHNLSKSFFHRFGDVQNVSGRFDRVHSHDWLTSNVMAWIKDAHGIPGILTMHSSEYGRCGNVFHGGNSELIRQHENHGTYCADRVVAVSKVLKSEISWMYNIPDWKVDVIYNGIQSKNFDGFIDQGKVKEQYGLGLYSPMVLFAGRLTAQKGPDILLRAIPAVLKHHGDAHFVFSGEGDMKEALEQEAHRLGVAHACRFVGYRNGEELTNLFKACDLVAVPSRNEPFGIVILEAWSAGKPVVATKNGGPAEFVWHEVNGLQVDAEENSIAWGICEVIRDTEKANWLGENGRKTAESSFCWDTISAQTEDVYNRI